MAVGRADRMGHLESLFGGGSVVGLSDGELLDRYLTSDGLRAEIAFEALVIRHGPMVWGVCRRALTDPTDADDAFQATFLILVRRARSVRVDDSLGRWLFGVSRKVAHKARAVRDRRRLKESVGPVPDRASISSARSEVLSALDDEVARLPEPFRSAVIHCDLGGLTHEEAAIKLGCPAGTIKSRLARGRDRLRARLVRRGFDARSASSLGGIATLPFPLIDSTVRSALSLAVRGSSFGPLTYPGLFLFKNGVVSMIFAAPLPWVAGTALAVALGASGLTWVSSSNDQDPPAPTQGAAKPAETKPTPEAAAAQANLPREFTKVSMPDYVVEPPDIIIVEVLGDLDGRPIHGERLVRPDGKISLGVYGDVYVAGPTLMEIKEKVILHLQESLPDSVLGLERMKDGQKVPVKPRSSTQVLVDVASYNSKVYYVQGDVGSPGRLPVTGNETVLDAINYAGGLIFPNNNKYNVRLVRPAPPGKCCEQTLPVDLDAIVEKADSKTNYQVFPGDRVIVYRNPKVTDLESLAGRNSVDLKKQSLKINEQEDRLRAIERKLDLILQKLDDRDKR